MNLMRKFQRFGAWLALPALVALFILAAPAPAQGAAGDEKGPRVNLNTATAEDLTSLPGIGPSYAKRIVEYREKNGPFKRVEDLLNVQGIGEKTLEKIRDRVTLSSGK
jgi:competence protein ComEA